MKASAVTFLDLELRNPAEEEAFHAWWREARALIQERAKPLRVDLLVIERGKYSVLMEFEFPGGFKIVTQDKPWQELETRRPPAVAGVRNARILGEHDIMTARLRDWIDERRAGKRDFVLVDALDAESFAKKHLPGAVTLPSAKITAETAERALGGAKDRPVVIYCAGYT
jgi:hypothetical protein